MKKVFVVIQESGDKTEVKVYSTKGEAEKAKETAPWVDIHECEVQKRGYSKKVS